MSIPALQARLFKARRIFNLWRTYGSRPERIHSVPLDGQVRQLLAIPWTRVLVTLEDETVHLHDWASGESCNVPLRVDSAMVISTVKVFWVDTIGCNVIIVALSNGRRVSSVRYELQLFAVDAEAMSASYLTTAEFAHGISGFALSDDHLAVFGHHGSWSYFIQSLSVSYESPCSISTTASVRIGTKGTLSTSSFAILDRTRFLLANPAGIAVYKFSERTLASKAPSLRRIRPCWEYRYQYLERIIKPPLGPVLIDNELGYKSVSRSLVDGFLAYMELAAGVHVGIYRGPNPATPYTFTTFPLSAGEDLKPLGAIPYPRGRYTGSVSHVTDGQEVMEPDSLNIDEGEGRIVFMTRSHARHSPKAVVLELV
ncbi:hypothetical protein DFH06DRAFT_1151806 [Mycena polygramma]|nr:hypothetical protein DFH06DRAFT_1151806 [Mycena polygramma]